MLRKQLYIDHDQQQKLSRLASRWGCSEAEVVRRALDRLEEPGSTLVSCLREAGLLIEDTQVSDRTPNEIAAAAAWFQKWLMQRTEPVGLSEAVMEDRG